MLLLLFVVVVVVVVVVWFSFLFWNEGVGVCLVCLFSVFFFVEFFKFGASLSVNSFKFSR